MGYAREYKESVIKFHFNGNSIVKTAKTFSIGVETVVRWKRELRDSGELHGRKVQDRKHLRKITSEKIEEFLEKFPDGNQQEMAEYLNCKPQAVQAALKKLGYSKKKNKSDIMKPMKANVRYIWQKSQE